MDDLARRQLAILARIEALEGRLGLTSTRKDPREGTRRSDDGSKSTANLDRLTNELCQRGITRYRFVRAPSDYYDRPLEYRQEILGAKSTHHLCKSIVMENTRVEDGVPDIAKYWMVVVQYTARLHADKLRMFVHAHHGDRLSKSKINMRLCAEDVSSQLTGFERNAVSPVGCKTALPIIISHRIAALGDDDQESDLFWLGAGEVDLKIGMHVKDFIASFSPFVVDCTYED
jgi:prolyl-tRNA editing enzyme YbaK/EbsC (Cys-tRNA(Pro) deacylase)